jgi:PilZ domain-containing protein
MSFSEFMERRAVDLRMGGRYSLADRRDMQGNRREFACRTIRISPFQMLVAAPVLGASGDRVITFFGELGKLEGWIADVVEGGFLVDIVLQKNARERLASKLVWLEKKQNAAVADARQQQRRVPEDPHTNLILADGATLSCFVIDMSPSGAAVSADIEPEIGTRLSVGRGVGHVVRRFGEGFAVQFDRLHDPRWLEQVIRPPADMGLDRSPLEVPPERAPVRKRREANEVLGRAALLPQRAMWIVD